MLIEDVLEGEDTDEVTDSEIQRVPTPVNGANTSSSLSQPPAPPGRSPSRRGKGDSGKENGTPTLTTAREQKKFAKVFPEIEKDMDTLTSVYTCALEREVLWQGKIYISGGHVAFYGKIFAKAAKVIINYRDVTAIEKKSTAGMFPNAIRITTANSRQYVFSSFLKRDAAFSDMTDLWKTATGKTTSVRATASKSKNTNEVSKPRASSNESGDSSLSADDALNSELEDWDDSSAKSSPLPSFQKSSSQQSKGLSQSWDQRRLSQQLRMHQQQPPQRSVSAFAASPMPLQRDSTTSVPEFTVVSSSDDTSMTSGTNTPSEVGSMDKMESPRVDTVANHLARIKKRSISSPLNGTPVMGAFTDGLAIGGAANAVGANVSAATPVSNSPDGDNTEDEQTVTNGTTSIEASRTDAAGEGSSGAATTTTVPHTRTGRSMTITSGVTAVNDFLRRLIPANMAPDAIQQAAQANGGEIIAKDGTLAIPPPTGTTVTNFANVNANGNAVLPTVTTLGALTGAHTAAVMVMGGMDINAAMDETIQKTGESENGSMGESRRISASGIAGGAENKTEGNVASAVGLGITPNAPSAKQQQEPQAPSRPSEPVSCGCESHLDHLLVDETFNMDVEDLFRAVFADGGSESVKEAHKRRETDALRFGNWSMDGEKFRARDVTYSPSFKPPLLPKTNTPCSERQNMIRHDELRFVVETVAKTPKVPYGDCFTTVVRYCISHAGPNKARLLVTGKVDFSKKTMWKDKIEAGGVDGMGGYAKELVNVLKDVQNKPKSKRGASTPGFTATADLSSEEAGPPSGSPSMRMRRKQAQRQMSAPITGSPSASSTNSGSTADANSSSTAVSSGTGVRSTGAGLDNGSGRVAGFLMELPMHILESFLRILAYVFPGVFKQEASSPAAEGGVSPPGSSRRRRYRPSQDNAGAAGGAGYNMAVAQMIGVLLLAVFLGIIVTAFNVFWMMNVSGRLDGALSTIHELKQQQMYAAQYRRGVGGVGGATRILAEAETGQQQRRRPGEDDAETEVAVDYDGLYAGYVHETRARMSDMRTALSELDRHVGRARHGLSQLEWELGGALDELEYLASSHSPVPASESASSGSGQEDDDWEKVDGWWKDWHARWAEREGDRGDGEERKEAGGSAGMDSSTPPNAGGFTKTDPDAVRKEESQPLRRQEQQKGRRFGRGLKPLKRQLDGGGEDDDAVELDDIEAALEVLQRLSNAAGRRTNPARRQPMEEKVDDGTKR
ncbi:hypothetical protein HK102_002055 [Quaeritorhiza haematococci]|nr:hypothetical protein HK102_002055 [Quaeritorhiza haematococci]